MKETIFCIISAFILYEVSGMIGKEMLADKHITGETSYEKSTIN